MSEPKLAVDGPSPARAEAARVIRAEADAIASLVGQLGSSFDEAVELCASRTADGKGSVIVSGIGKSGIVGTKLSATLASTGTPSHFLHSTEAMHGDLGRIRVNDVVLLLSFSGGGEEVLSLAALVKQDNVPVISMTSSDQSKLAKLSDVHISLGDLTEACPHNLAPTASTTAMLAMGDALAMAISKHKGFTADDYSKTHPGGTLGKQMLPITDVMRFTAGKNLPLIADTVSVRAAMDQAASVEGRRAGAALLVDSQGKLSGIFTDGDLRRMWMDAHAGPDTPIAKVMTKNPKRLGPGAVVRDAVQLVRELRLDEIPVVDDAGKPIGLIDVQDLIALRVVQG